MSSQNTSDKYDKKHTNLSKILDRIMLLSIGFVYFILNKIEAILNLHERYWFLIALGALVLSFIIAFIGYLKNYGFLNTKQDYEAFFQRIEKHYLTSTAVLLLTALICSFIGLWNLA